MTERETELTVDSKSGDKNDVFNFRGTGHGKDEVVDIDFGDGTKTSVIALDGNWHISYKYAEAGSFKVTVTEDDEVVDSVTVKVE